MPRLGYIDAMDYELKISVFTLGAVLFMRGVCTLTLQPIILHFMDIGFLCMGVFLVAGIVSGWLNAQKKPQYIWLGDLRFGQLTRQLVPMLVFFVLFVAVFFTGLFLLTPDIIELDTK